MHFVPGFISVTPIGFPDSDSVTLVFNGLSDAKTEEKKSKREKTFFAFFLGGYYHARRVYKSASLL